MTEAQEIALLMAFGAWFEALGVAVVGFEIRSSRRAVEKLAADLRGADERLARNHEAPLGDYLNPILALLVQITTGSRPLRVFGLLCLLGGIALTLLANVWALLWLDRVT